MFNLKLRLFSVMLVITTGQGSFTLSLTRIGGITNAPCGITKVSGITTGCE